MENDPALLEELGRVSEWISQQAASLQLIVASSKEPVAIDVPKDLQSGGVGLLAAYGDENHALKCHLLALQQLEEQKEENKRLRQLMKQTAKTMQEEALSLSRFSANIKAGVVKPSKASQTDTQAVTHEQYVELEQETTSLRLLLDTQQKVTATQSDDLQQQQQLLAQQQQQLQQKEQQLQSTQASGSTTQTQEELSRLQNTVQQQQMHINHQSAELSKCKQELAKHQLRWEKLKQHHYRQKEKEKEREGQRQPQESEAFTNRS